MAASGVQDIIPADEIDFHHPYVPYDIQNTFMKTVYDILESGAGNVGILESPTGTGKSLSLICASLTWLREHKRRQFEIGLEVHDASHDEPDWIAEQARAKKRRDLLGRREDFEIRLAKVREREKREKERWREQAKNGKRRRVDQMDNKTDHEEEFVLDEYNSDQEITKQSTVIQNVSGLSAQTLALMKQAGAITNSSLHEEEEEIVEETKIFYCSRTHSQLTQFTNELRRVKMPTALPPLKQEDRVEPGAKEEFKHVTLGSRKNLCINPEVSKLQSTTAINERCQELQDKKGAQNAGCCFLPNKDNKHLMNDFRDQTLAVVRDIEDMGTLGKEIGICPYYATREVIKPSEIVTLPYPSLLQKSTRQALGIDLTGHVVIIDEAHNLMDAIAGIHGVSLSLSELENARHGLEVYLQKFKNRLMGKNRVYVAQVLRLVDSLKKYLQRTCSVKHDEGPVVVSDLLLGGSEQIDLYKLLRYLQESKLARKVESYIIHARKQEEAKPTEINSRSVPQHTSERWQTMLDATAPTLHNVASLLLALTNPSQEGKIFWSRMPSETPWKSSHEYHLKYILLDPTHHFREIVDSARAVILAGGTMSPMADYTNHLLSYLDPSKITTLSCGHVIPKNNLLAWTLSSGPTRQNFEFTFSKRAGDEGEQMIDELGRGVLNICTVVPDGVVVFFPSYKYLDDVMQRWKNASPGLTSTIWERLSTKKSIFQETKQSGHGEDVLASYAHAIDQGKGGLLLSVIGGKMSEGINFSDQLGRCVIIVGLPFPNIMSGEWKSKMTYIEQSTEQRLAQNNTLTVATRKSMGQAAAREFYENACMRAVNQSVGRAIRHKGDYAAIIMIDVRFGNDRIRNKLPGWIQKGLVEGSDKKSFGALMGALGSFFREKKVS